MLSCILLVEGPEHSRKGGGLARLDEFQCQAFHTGRTARRGAVGDGFVGRLAHGAGREVGLHFWVVRGDDRARSRVAAAPGGSTGELLLSSLTSALAAAQQTDGAINGARFACFFQLISSS